MIITTAKAAVKQAAEEYDKRKAYKTGGLQLAWIEKAIVNSGVMFTETFDDTSAFPSDDRVVIVNFYNSSEIMRARWICDDDGGGYWQHADLNFPFIKANYYVKGWCELSEWEKVIN